MQYEIENIIIIYNINTMSCNKYIKNNDLNNKFPIDSYAQLDAAYNVSDTMSEFENRINQNNSLNGCRKKSSSPRVSTDFYHKQNNIFDDVLSPESEEQINKNIDQLFISTDNMCQKRKLIQENTIPYLSTSTIQQSNVIEPFVTTQDNICISKIFFIVVVIILLIIGIYFLARNSSENAGIQNLSTFSDIFSTSN